MKKSPIKEFIITSVAAAVAGLVVKKVYQYFQEANENPQTKKKANQNNLSAATAKALDTSSQKIGHAIDQSSAAEKGLVGTVAYTVTAFLVSKMLRKVI